MHAGLLSAGLVQASVCWAAMRSFEATEADDRAHSTCPVSWAWAALAFEAARIACGCWGCLSFGTCCLLGLLCLPHPHFLLSMTIPGSQREEEADEAESSSSQVIAAPNSNAVNNTWRKSAKQHYTFWETQPVVQFSEQSGPQVRAMMTGREQRSGADLWSLDRCGSFTWHPQGDGPIDKPKTVEEVKQEPYTLPDRCLGLILRLPARSSNKAACDLPFLSSCAAAALNGALVTFRKMQRCKR